MEKTTLSSQSTAECVVSSSSEIPQSRHQRSKALSPWSSGYDNTLTWCESAVRFRSGSSYFSFAKKIGFIFSKALQQEWTFLRKISVQRNPVRLFCHLSLSIANLSVLQAFLSWHSILLLIHCIFSHSILLFV